MGVDIQHIDVTMMLYKREVFVVGGIPHAQTKDCQVCVKALSFYKYKKKFHIVILSAYNLDDSPSITTENQIYY